MSHISSLLHSQEISQVLSVAIVYVKTLETFILPTFPHEHTLSPTLEAEAGGWEG